MTYQLEENLESGQQRDHNVPLAYTVAQLRKRLGPGVIGRSRLYEEIRQGRLKVIYAGKKILISAQSVAQWLNGKDQCE